MVEYYGACSCDSAKFTVTGEPLFTQYCHCNKCREILARSNRTEDNVGHAFTAAYLTKMLTQLKMPKGQDRDIYFLENRLGRAILML